MSPSALRSQLRTNIPQAIVISQRWGVSGQDGAVVPLGSGADPGRGLKLTKTGVGSYTVSFAPNTDGTLPQVKFVIHPIVTVMDGTVPNIVHITNIPVTGCEFVVTNIQGLAEEVGDLGQICVTLICTTSSVLV